jgi:hypothetical protein
MAAGLAIAAVFRRERSCARLPSCLTFVRASDHVGKMPRPANTPSQMRPVGQGSPAQSRSEAPPEPPHERSRPIHPDTSS